MATSPLNDAKVKTAKFDEPGESNMRPDGDGLFLHIEKRKNGDVVKTWLMRVYYRPHEDAKLKEVRFSLGKWPKVSLDDARAGRAEAIQRAKEYKHPNPRKQERAIQVARWFSMALEPRRELCWWKS